MKLKPYPEYKPSGLPLLGDVPEHWNVKRSDKFVSAETLQLAPETFAELEVFHYSIPVVQKLGTGQIENGDSIASAKQAVEKPLVLVSRPSNFSSVISSREWAATYLVSNLR